MVQNSNKASFWQLFWTFAKIGAFTIGGGYAMLAVIRSEIVKRGWMDDEEFTDVVALAQSAPGLLAVNISIFVGHKIRGTMGSVVATIGSVTPSFLIILFIAIAFSDYMNNPTVIRIFKGIRPVVVALIATPMINMAKSSNKKWWAWAMSAIVMGLVAFMKISPIYILLVVMVSSAAISYYRNR